MAANLDLIEQLLADTWTDESAARIVDEVAAPGHRGHIVRDVQPDAVNGEPLYVDGLIADAFARETGIDIEWARRDSTWSAYDQVFELLCERWVDGGTLPAVPAYHCDEAHRLLTDQLTRKAAEWAGCAVTATDTSPVPLVAGGLLRVDLEGLHRYLALFIDHGVHPAERGAIHRLHEIAT